MLLGLLTLALAVSTSAGESSLDECIDRSERIASVLVTKVAPVRQRYPFLDGSEWPRAVIEVAELYVETPFVGPPDDHFLYAALQDARAPLKLEAGQHYLLFLELDRTWTRANEGTRSAIASVTHGARLYQVSSCEGVKLRLLDEQGKLANPQPNSWGLTDLEKRVDARLPFLFAYEISTGPAPWNLHIAKDRTVTGAQLEPTAMDPALPGHLSDERDRAVWSALDAQRFNELPEVIGSSPGPDATELAIEVHARQGPRRIRFYPQDPAAIESAQLRDELRRALAIWDALPATVGRKR